MRKTFAQVVKNNEVDIKREYLRLYHMFFDINQSLNRNGSPDYCTSIYKIVESGFSQFRFRGTAISLDDFNVTNGYCFQENPNDFDLDYLINFCEYLYNILNEYVVVYRDSVAVNWELFKSQIHKVTEAVGYEINKEDGFFVIIKNEKTNNINPLSTFLSFNCNLVDSGNQLIKNDTEINKKISSDCEPYDPYAYEIDVIEDNSGESNDIISTGNTNLFQNADEYDSCEHENNYYLTNETSEYENEYKKLYSKCIDLSDETGWFYPDADEGRESSDNDDNDDDWEQNGFSVHKRIEY